MDLPDSNPKTRFGVAKPGIADVPMAALLPLGLAMRDGKNKYGRTNWREHEVTASVYFDAAFRHMASWWDGEEVASDSLVHHLGHVMACCSILLDAQAHGKLIDDRPGVPGKFAEMVKALTKPLETHPASYDPNAPLELSDGFKQFFEPGWLRGMMEDQDAQLEPGHADEQLEILEAAGQWPDEGATTFGDPSFPDPDFCDCDLCDDCTCDAPARVHVRANVRLEDLKSEVDQFLRQSSTHRDLVLMALDRLGARKVVDLSAHGLIAMQFYIDNWSKPPHEDHPSMQEMDVILARVVGGEQ